MATQSKPGSKRLPKDQRRAQLLETALQIVRDEGTEGLTLARLAERAGVTKPIAYEHFCTRGGLLIAIFKDYDDRTTEAVRKGLAIPDNSLENVASLLSTAYVDACLLIKPEVGAVFDALSDSEETRAFRKSWRKFIVEEFRKGFAPLVKMPRKRMETLLIGIIGAAAAVAQEAASGRLSRKEAIAAVEQLMLGAFAA